MTLPSSTPRKGLRSPSRLHVSIRRRGPTWPAGLVAQVQSSDFMTLMLDIRATLLSFGFPVCDDVPSSDSDTRASYLPPGVVGVSIGERGVGLDHALERRRSLRWLGALTLGLVLSGIGFGLIGNGPRVNPVILVFITPGSLLCGYALVSALATYFQSEVLQVVIRVPPSAGGWSLPPPKSWVTLEVSGGRARTENGPYGRMLRAVVQDAQVNSVLGPLVSQLESVVKDRNGPNS